MVIVSNNPRVVSEINYPIIKIDGTYLDVLLHVKDLIINNKYRLLSHPLSGSIKPNETYYKSIMLDNSSFDYSDLDSLELIESAIEVYNKFIKNEARPNWSNSILNDFADVDYFLIKSAIESANH